MNTTPSADGILGTSQKPKMLSLTFKSCPCVISSWSPQNISWQRVLSAFSRSLWKRRHKNNKKLLPKGCHYITVNDLLNQSFCTSVVPLKGSLGEKAQQLALAGRRIKGGVAWDSCCQDPVYRESHAGRRQLLQLELPLQCADAWLGFSLRFLTAMRTAEGWMPRVSERAGCSGKECALGVQELGLLFLLFSLVWSLCSCSLLDCSLLKPNAPLLYCEVLLFH